MERVSRGLITVGKKEEMNKVDVTKYNSLKAGDIIFVSSLGYRDKVFGILPPVKAKLISIASKSWRIYDEKGNATDNFELRSHHIIFINVNRKKKDKEYNFSVVCAGRFIVYTGKK